MTTTAATDGVRRTGPRTVGAPVAASPPRWGAVFALALTLVGRSVVGVVILLAAWGLFGTAASVAWWTWLTRTLSNDAESGGGLMVAVIQVAIARSATAGGITYDAKGPRTTVTLSAVVLAGSALVAWQSRAGTHTITAGS